MNALKPFQISTTPLGTGVCLIEASAGTGKTFTIAGLFLRLVLEQDLSVREILVVTFTEAATEELRERIRNTLVDALRVLNGGTAQNPTVAEIVGRALRLSSVAATVRSQAGLSSATESDTMASASGLASRDLTVAATSASMLRSRFERALRAFDEAPICTIHSFCQRTLRDHAFESGALFDTDLMPDDSELLQSVADDYWRRRFYATDPLLVSVALHAELSPETLVDWLRLQIRHPSLRVISGVTDRSLDQLAQELRTAFEAARAQWQVHQEQIRGFFTPSAPWAKSDHSKPAVVTAWLDDIARCFADGNPTPESIASLEHFTPEALKKSTKARKQTPEHEFFRRCAAFHAAQSGYLTGLRLDFAPAAQAALRRHKQELKVQSFDDLLTELLRALEGDSGPALVAEVRRKFRAALIDEFQDTDPVQWEVFRKLFAALVEPGRERESGQKGRGAEGKRGRGAQGADSPLLLFPSSPVPASEVAQPVPAPFSGPSLYLIGDPKQAIYGFRGADIFTYLDAAEGATDGFTLDRNWRSESALVNAVDTFFGGAQSPFVFDKIAFPKVHAAGSADKTPLQENGKSLAPLRFWFMPREAGKNEISKEFAEENLPGVVAAEIVRLLNGPTTLGARRLTPRDIAVLVRENRQAALMQDALRRVGVPSVLHTEESVFTSREASELERVLNALAQPGYERALRAALVTDLMGLNGASLEEMTDDEAAWQGWRETFRAHHERWLELGFMPMFRHWLHASQVRQRLLEFEDGERRLTNLLQLAEALHAATQEHLLGPAQLARWLAEQINSKDRASEEHQLRLERDDESVRLVTIHKSKGLEYPVVFCPFSWKSSHAKEDVLFHVTPTSTPALTPSLTLTHSPSLSESKREKDARGSKLILDLGSPDLEMHRRLAFREKLAENLRLLYVALTRAQNRCYFIWGAFRGAATSAAAWLLHRPLLLDEDWQAAMTAQFKTLNDAALEAGLKKLERSSAINGTPTIQVERLPAATGERYRPQSTASVELRSRRFTGAIRTNWRITSFSGLVAGKVDELPDHDADAPSASPVSDLAAAATEGIFAFPRGTRAGTCLHQILEQLEFTQTDDAELRRLVESKLKLNGIAGEEFVIAVCDTVRRALATPLDLVRPDFALSRVARGERIPELEFFLPVRELTPALLRHGLAPAGDELMARLRALGFKPTGGFLKGFIDLVFRFEGQFYIVDWKSNWLGNRVEDYGPAAMRAEMARKFYSLQAHLYVVALHEHLRVRVPGYRYDEHFGGVRYIFLRGLDPARPELGVYRDRPEAGTIETLAKSLRNGEPSAVRVRENEK